MSRILSANSDDCILNVNVTLPSDFSGPKNLVDRWLSATDAVTGWIALDSEAQEWEELFLTTSEESLLLSLMVTPETVHEAVGIRWLATNPTTRNFLQCLDQLSSRLRWLFRSSAVRSDGNEHLKIEEKVGRVNMKDLERNAACIAGGLFLVSCTIRSFSTVLTPVEWGVQLELDRKTTGIGQWWEANTIAALIATNKEMGSLEKFLDAVIDAIDLLDHRRYYRIKSFASEVILSLLAVGIDVTPPPSPNSNSTAGLVAAAVASTDGDVDIPPSAVFARYLQSRAAVELQNSFTAPADSQLFSSAIAVRLVRGLFNCATTTTGVQISGGSTSTLRHGDRVTSILITGGTSTTTTTRGNSKIVTTTNGGASADRLFDQFAIAVDNRQAEKNTANTSEQTEGGERISIASHLLSLWTSMVAHVSFMDMSRFLNTQTIDQLPISPEHGVTLRDQRRASNRFLQDRATQALLLLLHQARHVDSRLFNAFRSAFDLLVDNNHSHLSDCEDLAPSGLSINRVHVDFTSALRNIGALLPNANTVLLLYTLCQMHASFPEFLSVPEANSAVLIRILEGVYEVCSRKPNTYNTDDVAMRHRLYLLAVVWLLLSHDASATIVITNTSIVAPWFVERPHVEFKMADLIVLVALRAFTFSVIVLEDAYLVATLSGVLMNLLPAIRDLHPFAGERLIRTICRFSRRVAVTSPDPMDDPSNTEVAESNELTATVLSTLLQFVATILRTRRTESECLLYALVAEYNLFEKHLSNRSVVAALLPTGSTQYVIFLRELSRYFRDKLEDDIRLSHRPALTVRETMDLLRNAIVQQAAESTDAGVLGIETDCFLSGAIELPDVKARYMYQEAPRPDEFFLPCIWTSVLASTPELLWQWDRIQLIDL